MVKQVIADHQQFSFQPSSLFKWSPSDKTIYYSEITDDRSIWTLLHELGHALLEHMAYHTDIELIQMERAAWHKACMVAQSYNLTISSDYIEDCMDTYRDWINKRSTCPVCSNVSLQHPSGIYSCFNCLATWSVPSSQLCRIRRIRTHKK